MGKWFTTKKIKFLFFSLMVCTLPHLSNAQFVQRWSSVISSEGPSGNVKNCIIITSDGNIVSAGERKIIKYSPQGKIIWTTDVTLPATLTSQGFSMASDNAGNIYVTAARALNTGFFSGLTDFFVAKYNSDGQQLWSQLYNGPGKADDEAVGIALDQFGNVYLAGTSFNFNFVGKIYTAKFNTDGVMQWQVTHPVEGKANDIVVDFFTGDVYVTGGTFIPKDGDVLHLEDFTTIKYNTNGEEQWVSLYNGSLDIDPTDEAQAIAMDADGNVIATGFSSEKANSDFIAGSTMITTIKYDRNDGSEMWNKKFGFKQEHGGDFIDSRGHSNAVDADGNIIVIGASGIDPGFSHTIKYRGSDGNELWDKTFDNTQFDDHNGSLIGFDIPSALAIDKDNNVFVTGLSTFNNTGNDIMTFKYKSSDGSELGRASFDNGSDEGGSGITVDSKGNAYVNGAGDHSFITVSYGPCAIVCPSDITVNNETGKCGASINFTATTTGNCGTLTFTENGSTVKSGNFFSVGKHNILVSSPTTGETCNFTITVVDNENPVITQCASPLTVSCAASVPLPDISLIKATDNCGTVTISHAGDVITNQTCTNKFTLTRTYMATDSHGNTATCTQVITVNDNIPPQINNFSLSTETLSPPNHTMRDVTLNYQVIDNCVSAPPVSITITSNEPVNGTGDGDTDPDWIVVDAHHIKLRAERAANGNGRIYTITVTADDGCNPAVSVTKQVRVAHNITGPISGNPFKIGSTVNLTGVFWDKPGNTHSAKWLLDSSTTIAGNITEPTASQNGKVTGSYKFNSAGVYKLQMNTTDQTGNTSYANTNGDLDAIVVIYDPNGGTVYGGGWFNSPAGALVSNPSVTGKASYGFAVNYKNAVKPTGETQFSFKDGSFEFNAVNFDYLVINGAMAQFRGTGKITGGQSGIGFIMTVIDGALDGGSADRIRMKIYNRNTGAILYDNQPGASDAALPTAAVGSNSSIVIQGNNTSSSAPVTKQESSTEEINVNGLNVAAYPNPTTRYFNVTINSNNVHEKITVQVFDQNGRLNDLFENVLPNSKLQFGENYKSGSYFVRVMQGEEHKEIKLIKAQ